MVSVRDIQPGEIIFSDQAAIVGPSSESLPVCLECFALVRSTEIQWSKSKRSLKRRSNLSDAECDFGE